MTAEQRRKHLIDVALQLFAKHGFEGTTTKAIGAATGVSESVIFRHFATKEELYTAILEARTDDSKTLFRELQEYADGEKDEEMFLHLALKIVDAYRRDADFQRVMLYASLEGHEISKVSNRLWGMPTFTFLRDYIRQRQKQGAFQNCDPGLVVFALISMPLYYGIVTRLFGIQLLKKSDQHVATTFVSLLLDGLRASQKPRKSRGSDGKTTRFQRVRKAMN